VQDWLSALLGSVCGQYPSHVWMPGGWALPCCQRCTGLYVGAALAVLLHGRFCRTVTSASSWWHGLCLLQMVPFGFHWVPQGPVLRTVTGYLFAWGVVFFLWPAAAARIGKARPNGRSSRERASAPGAAEGPLGWRPGTAGYVGGFVAGVVLAPGLARWGGQVGAYLLAGLVVLGALALGWLALLNLVALCATAAQTWRRHFRRVAA